MSFLCFTYYPDSSRHGFDNFIGKKEDLESAKKFILTHTKHQKFIIFDAKYHSTHFQIVKDDKIILSGEIDKLIIS